MDHHKAHQFQLYITQEVKKERKEKQRIATPNALGISNCEWNVEKEAYKG